MKFRDIFRVRKESEEESAYPYVEWLDGSYSRLKEGIFNSVDTKVFAAGNTSSQGSSVSTRIPFEFCGKQFFPSGVGAGWKTNFDGLNRLSKANRLLSLGNTLVYRRYLDDFPAVRFNATWDDTVQSTFAVQKLYVVQTANKVIERCILMTTDPGDLVLDPTCGSGTTAYVAEQWGRRWLTIDTSRVALSITRQRLLTATFPMYKTRGEDGANPGDGFLYRTIPHITLKSIAQNLSLDSIFAKYEHILEKNIVALNSALKTVTPEIRSKLEKKLMEKANMEGKRSITDADERRWKIPETSWQEWEVPFDSDPDWPRELRETLTAYRITWRSKMNEVNKAIEDNAELEELVDQPEVAKNVMRVSGPFSVEAVMPAEERLDLELDSDQPNLETFDGDDLAATEPVNAEAYLNKMVRLMRVDGVRFLGNKKLNFDRLEQRSDDYLHAEGESSLEDGFMRRIAVSFGPQYGPVTSVQVENAIRRAARGGFDDLVFAGFSFDATAQAIVQDDANPNIRIHLAHIRPDVMPGMDGLLKNSKNSELFTVFGSPRSSLKALPEGEFEVVMDGVDIYNPVENTVSATNADKVAAWFLDSDYDGRTFCITQAFFPDKSAWEKIGRALKGALDEERLAAFAGKTSLPFKPGKHGRVAVKVIDPRGNEVMRVHSIPAEVRL